MDGAAPSSASERGYPYGTLVRVWIALLALTALLVLLSEWQHESLSVGAMLAITPTKAGLVLWYFMRLRRERTLFRAMLFVALAALVVFIGLLFLDVSYR
mgnify:CR=1 FL=1